MVIHQKRKKGLFFKKKRDNLLTFLISLKPSCDLCFKKRIKMNNGFLLRLSPVYTLNINKTMLPYICYCIFVSFAALYFYGCCYPCSPNLRSKF